MIALVVVVFVVAFVAAKRRHRRINPRSVTPQSVAHVLQLPELDGPRYRRKTRRPRRFKFDGRP